MNKISFDFSGTTTVITGGSSGIGLAAAELIAASGGNIIVSASRSSEKTKQALSNILSARSKSTHHAPEAPVAFEYDAGDETSVTAFFAQVAASTKRVDYIIHSAAISPDEDYENQDWSLWDRVSNTNISGTALVLKHGSALMQKQAVIDEERGRFALVTSTNGIDSYGIFSAPYDASKAANNLMVRNIGEHLHREHAIVVNGLAPGWINTELNNTLPPEERVKESAKIWSNRFAEPAEMATHLAYLLTAPYLSWRVIMTDGGYR